MITVYNRIETDFSHNGFGIVMPLSAVVTEELNGMYELHMVLQYKENKEIMPYLKEFNIIRANTPYGFQLFRIYSTVKTLYQYEINARHIFYDCLNNITERVNLFNATGAEAVKALFASARIQSAFNVYSDISTRADVFLQDINPVYGILGDEGLHSLFGGELKRDNFDIYYMNEIGRDRGVSISYGKNLTGIDISLDTSQISTAIRPVAKQNDDSPLYLPEGYAKSPNIGLYPTPIYSVLHCRDIKVTKNLPVYEAYAIMRQRANMLLETGIDLPRVNAKINFVVLKETEEYKNYAFLEEIFLGDTVHVKYEELGISLRAKCIKYIFDCISNKFISIEIGNMRDNFAAFTGAQIIKLSNNVAQMQPASVDDLIQRLSSHAHTGADNTVKIDYHNLLNQPK